MKENLVFLEILSYLAIFFFGILAFVHAGDFIAYLLKKFPPNAERPKRARSNAVRKPRRRAGLA